LKLTKRPLSLNLNVSDITIYLWERNKVRPSLAQIPKIIEFLGYDPFKSKAESLADKLKAYTRVHGLSEKKFADMLRVDQATLAGWERGDVKRLVVLRGESAHTFTRSALSRSIILRAIFP
jgi:DNA-binding transcriptional regulator YiaG